MSRATQQMENFAKSLMACEAFENKSSETSPETFQVFNKLRPQLVILMGTGGFCALLSHALALATAEIPWLRAVHVKADGSLEGLTELHPQLDPDKFLEGRIILLAQLLGLLTAFIGENLTLRLMREVWPEASFNGLGLSNGGNNEKTK
jgi:hypothetical protein